MNLEIEDALKEAAFSLKFVSLKPKYEVPSRLFFVYKFFNNKNTQTDTVFGKPYDGSHYLVKEGSAALTFEQILESAIQDTYMVTADDHAPFINYLNT